MANIIDQVYINKEIFNNQQLLNKCNIYLLSNNNFDIKTESLMNNKDVPQYIHFQMYNSDTDGYYYHVCYLQDINGSNEEIISPIVEETLKILNHESEVKIKYKQYEKYPLLNYLEKNFDKNLSGDKYSEFVKQINKEYEEYLQMQNTINDNRNEWRNL